MTMARTARESGADTTPTYTRHRPEQTLLYQLVERYYPEFESLMADQNKPLPAYIRHEFNDFLQCGCLEHGFFRVRCEDCHHEKLVAFSCKRRGFCPSCGVRRMVDSAALLVDEVLPKVAMRQWVLSVPFQLRFLFASYPHLMSKALSIVTRCISTHLIHKAGFTHASARTGAVTFIQRFGTALNLNVHLTCRDALMPWAQGCAGTAHILFLDGVYSSGFDQNKQVFQRVNAPTQAELQVLVHTLSERLGRFLVKEGVLLRTAI